MTTAFPGIDIDTLEPRASSLLDIRTLKAGLDLRRQELEEGRRRLKITQGRLAQACGAYGAERAGLQSELRALGRSGEQLGASLATQGSLLQRQQETLESEREALQVLRDEARRLRAVQRQQPVPEGGPRLRAVRPGEALWEDQAPPLPPPSFEPPPTGSS
eukprot:TRINITY_DN90930_c0_g1_i1.p2 TRINITY_DN90930_c0_g1~~TRINITY_DN90930_c0_g1_i1.p2  ORF type:complete len:161 (-),score=30.82 TRINITY_DN90930_c0_g1_i1:394-876(-)